MKAKYPVSASIRERTNYTNDQNVLTCFSFFFFFFLTLSLSFSFLFLFLLFLSLSPFLSPFSYSFSFFFFSLSFTDVATEKSSRVCGKSCVMPSAFTPKSLEARRGFLQGIPCIEFLVLATI